MDRRFNGDTHLLDWLDHDGIEVDCITDEDLEAEGVSLLEPYRVILTGTHPEHPSKRMSDAMLAWQGQGGRLMYLGANGWYWRIAWHGSLSHNNYDNNVARITGNVLRRFLNETPSI